jgi:hypothetical protein
MLRPLLKLALALLGISIAAGIASALAAVNLKKSAPPRPEPDADEIDFVTVMDGAKLASTASAFRGGRLVCWYAGVDLDLRGATLDPAGAHLDVRTAFGGTRIVVAPGVPVRVGGPAIFGGVMNETGAAEPTAEQACLEIGGFTVFGGLQVIAAEPGLELAGWGDDDEAAGRSDGDLEPAATLAVEADATPA